MLLFAFLGLGVWRTLATGNSFYLLNFGYIGCAIFATILLHTRLGPAKRDIGRKISLVLVGGYMLGYLGFLRHENMQIEGFFIYLFSGVFAGATLHYLVAKILIPFVWGRAWCGWACWTAALLDFLPWKRSTGRVPGLGYARYIHFIVVLSATVWLYFFLDFRFGPDNELQWLLWGNVLYYILATAMACLFKDNRAFCKYLCPITAFLKLSAFSLSKFEIDADSCTECGQCTRACPMDIDLLAYARHNQRILSSECIFCFVCQNACPTNSIRVTHRPDCGFSERLITRK